MVSGDFKFESWSRTQCHGTVELMATHSTPSSACGSAMECDSAWSDRTDTSEIIAEREARKREHVKLTPAADNSESLEKKQSKCSLCDALLTVAFAQSKPRIKLGARLICPQWQLQNHRGRLRLMPQRRSPPDLSQHKYR
jgi:hypothetical protein